MPNHIWQRRKRRDLHASSSQQTRACLSASSSQRHGAGKQTRACVAEQAGSEQQNGGRQREKFRVFFFLKHMCVGVV